MKLLYARSMVSEMEIYRLPSCLLSALYPKVTLLFNINFAPPNQTYPVRGRILFHMSNHLYQLFVSYEAAAQAATLRRFGGWWERDIFYL